MNTSAQPASTIRSKLLSPLGEVSVFGPREGYSPQISILVSQLDWMRQVVLTRLQNLSQEDLDWLPTPQSNSIGALALHLAATETYYQIHTFDGHPWADTSPEIKTRWGAAMKLGDIGRERIRGHDLAFYLNALKEAREDTLTELRTRDDQWLMSVDENWGWGPTNNWCKWFHVCEHESHHLGQIDLHLKVRRPSASSH